MRQHGCGCRQRVAAPCISKPAPFGFDAAQDIRPGIKPDFDNIAKLVGDALNGLVWTDDKLIVEARVRKIYGLQPKIVLTVWPNKGNLESQKPKGGDAR